MISKTRRLFTLAAAAAPVLGLLGRPAAALAQAQGPIKIA